MSYFILAFGWVVYFILHSVLAKDEVKAFAVRQLGKAFRFYRVIYSIISSLGLAGLLVLNGSMHAAYFFESAGLVRYLSLMLTTFGVMTIQIAFRQYSLKSFLGFADERNELKIEGILKYVRHPIYTGLIMVTIGFFLFIPNLPTLVSCLSILVYLPIGIYLEERKLIQMFGEKYILYKQNVPSIIPKLPIDRLTF